MTEQEAWDLVFDTLADNATAKEWNVFIDNLAAHRSIFRAGWRLRGLEADGTAEDSETSSAEAQPTFNFKIGDRVRTTGVIPGLEGHIVGVGFKSCTIDVPGWDEVAVPKEDVEAA